MFSKTLVIRRGGGLEDNGKMVELSHGVIRRVGGLEDLFRHETDEQVVIRRVGGLEVNVDAAAFFL